MGSINEGRGEELLRLTGGIPHLKSEWLRVHFHEQASGEIRQMKVNDL